MGASSFGSTVHHVDKNYVLAAQYQIGINQNYKFIQVSRLLAQYTTAATKQQQNIHAK